MYRRFVLVKIFYTKATRIVFKSQLPPKKPLMYKNLHSQATCTSVECHLWRRHETNKRTDALFCFLCLNLKQLEKNKTNAHSSYESRCRWMWDCLGRRCRSRRWFPWGTILFNLIFVLVIVIILDKWCRASGPWCRTCWFSLWKRFLCLVKLFYVKNRWKKVFVKDFFGFEL